MCPIVAGPAVAALCVVLRSGYLIVGRDHEGTGNMGSAAHMSVITEDRQPAIHPLYVRATHWINALAVLVMIGSGWQIYNASPLFAFAFPNGATLGGWLAGALLWHFAAM